MTFFVLSLYRETEIINRIRYELPAYHPCGGCPGRHDCHCGPSRRSSAVAAQCGAVARRLHHRIHLQGRHFHSTCRRRHSPSAHRRPRLRHRARMEPRRHADCLHQRPRRIGRRVRYARQGRHAPPSHHPQRIGERARLAQRLHRHLLGFRRSGPRGRSGCLRSAGLHRHHTRRSTGHALDHPDAGRQRRIRRTHTLSGPQRLRERLPQARDVVEHRRRMAARRRQLHQADHVRR